MTKFPLSLRALGTAVVFALCFVCNHLSVTAQCVEILAFNSEWRYNDRGPRDLGTAWGAPFYPGETNWPLSRAPFVGMETNPAVFNIFGANPPTTLSLNGTNGNSYITAYFRTTFVLTNQPVLGVELVLSNLIDDGAVFYLNGVELNRIRMPASISYNTPAASASTEAVWDVVTFPATNCVVGTNHLAVELHQYLTAPLDRVFAAQMCARTAEPIRIARQPVATNLQEGVSQTFSVQVAGAQPYFYQWYRSGRSLAGARSSSITITNPSLADQGVYYVECSNLFSRVASTNINYKPLGTIPTVTTQPAVSNLVYHGDGVPLSLAADAIGSSPLYFQWYFNNVPISAANNPSATNRVLMLAPPTTNDIGAFRVLVTNRIGRATSSWANVHVKVPGSGPGAIDVTFRGATFPAQRVINDGSGRLLVGGHSLVSGGIKRQPLTRLFEDGSNDPSFTPNVTNWVALVYSLAVQTDGRILVGGDMVNNRGGIARLMPDGSPDPSFNPTGTRAEGSVQAIAIQADGKIVIGGQFTRYDGAVRPNFARLNQDGTLDTSFVVGAGFDQKVNAICILTNDNKILVGGSFNKYQNTNRSSIVRINPDGSWDSGFAIGGGTLQGSVNDVIATTNGFLLGGNFSATYGGAVNRYVAKINSNGYLLPEFLIGRILNGGAVHGMAEQRVDGRLVVAGTFYWTNALGQQVLGVARVLGDGALDYGFDPGRGLGNPGSWSVAVHPGGRLVLAGVSAFDGVPRPNIIRIIDSIAAPLGLRMVGPGLMVLNWPVTSVSDRFTVQWRSAQPGGRWTDLSGTHVVGNRKYWMTNQVTGQHRLFRLVRRR